MARPTPALVPLFAAPFAVVPVAADAQLNAALGALFLARATEQFRDPAGPQDPLCFRSREDLFEWPDPVVEQLRREVLAGVCAAVMAVSLYSEAEFSELKVQARARFSLVRANGSIAAASAPMASWFALYCVAAPLAASVRADSGVLRLYGTRTAGMFMDAANWNLREPFGGSHQLWRPVPGEMAVFPASILHEVALNRTESNLVLVGARVRFAHAAQAASPPW